MYEYKARVLKVVDGDTIDMDIDLGCEVHINTRCRMYGINAPERDPESTAFLRTILNELPEWLLIKTFKDKQDKYGRYLVEIPHNGSTVNQLMIDNGKAVSYVP